MKNQIIIPEALKTIHTRPLFVMKLSVKPMTIIGDTPAGFRRMGIVTGGEFQGERISGEVLDGGADWQTVRKDGAVLLDVKLNLKTDDGALVSMYYRGIRTGAPAVLKNIDAGKDVDPSSYYFRTNPVFETASEKYNWLNNFIGIGTGHRTASGPIYNVFEIL